MFSTHNENRAADERGEAPRSHPLEAMVTSAQGDHPAASPGEELPRPAATAHRADQMVQLVGKAVARQRAVLRISQELLSTRSGLHRTYISDIERGCRSVSFKNVCRLAWALDLEPSALINLAEQIGKEDS